MDIAEIRKKAKAQAASDPLANASDLSSAAEQAPESVPESFDLEADAEEFATASDQMVVLNEENAPDHRDNDGLDRLFDATDGLVLATDESYADVLDNQVDSKSENSRQYLAFHLCEEEYALDIRRISEIIKVREFTDIPRAPEFILGIISLRGVVVPVFDLRLRLKLGEAEQTSASRIVVCQQEDVTVGLLVDSINQVVNLADEEVEPPPGVLVGLDRDMVSGIGRYQGRMIILLNLQSALNVELIQD